ncbi:MAG: acyl-CoA thioesterase-2 [Patiriisocius sp.]
MTVLESLVDQLDLEQIDVNLFRGQSTSMGGPRVFGGQVLGQALIAALRTVLDRPCHSLHGYFLRPGDPNIPIIYEVDRIRDGKSFATRRIVAIQKGEAIFSMAASFQVEEQGLSHQDQMPDVPPPDSCYSEDDLFADNLAGNPELQEQMKAMRMNRPIEMRRVEPISFVNPVAGEPIQHTWFRSKQALPDDPAIHQCILTYASDMGLLSTSALPHGQSFFTGLQSASLDHVMWYHRSFRADEWVLFAMDSPTSGGARGFNRGKMYTEDGVLIASVAQEGLIREPRR